MKDLRLFQIGVAGSGVTALCCVTPLAVWSLSALGIIGAVAWLDWVLLPAFAAFLVLTLVAWRRLRARRKAGSGADRPAALTLVTFAGCPHAGPARDLLAQSGQPFVEVRQDDLPADHPHRRYTSPSLLAADGRVLWGSASAAPGCSVGGLDAAALHAALQGASTPDPLLAPAGARE